MLKVPCRYSAFYSHLLYLLRSAKCAEINVGTSEEHFDIHADFNVGFAPDLWVEWLELQGRPVLRPIKEAVELVKPENNFLEIHRWMNT